MKFCEPNPFTDEKTAKEWISTLEYEHSKGDKMDRKKIIYPYIQKWLAECNFDGTLLDLGSGEGFLSTIIPQNINYVGIEPSKYLIEDAKNRKERIGAKFIIGNAYDTGLPSNSAEGVVSVMVWFHLQDLERAAVELFRNLKTRGNFLIITSNPHSRKIWESFYKNLEIEGKRLKGKVNTPGYPMDESIIYIHTNDEMEKSLRNAGLTVNKIQAIGSPEKNEDKLFVAISGCK